MNERTPLFVAAGIGVLGVAGLALTTRHANSAAPRLLGRSLWTAKGNRGTYVRLSFEPSPSLLRLAKEGETWEYRVAEPGGRVYAAAINADENTHSMDVPYAYGRPTIAPRLEVWHNDDLLGWTDLGSLPPPRIERLPARPSPLLRAFHAPPVHDARSDGEPKDAVRFASRRPLPPGEYWTLTVVRTPLDPHPNASATVRAGHAPAPAFGGLASRGIEDQAALRYATDVNAVEVHGVRWAHRLRSETVVLHGLRLVTRDGQTALEWNGTPPRAPFGLSFRPDPRSTGYAKDTVDNARHQPQPFPGDSRWPYLNFVRESTLAFGSGRADLGMARFTSLPQGWSDLREQTAVAFHQPDFHWLHIRKLTIGGASWTAPHPDPGPVNRRPFDAVLRIAKEWNEPVGTFEATIPVEPAQGRR